MGNLMRYLILSYCSTVSTLILFRVLLYVQYGTYRMTLQQWLWLVSELTLHYCTSATLGGYGRYSSSPWCYPTDCSISYRAIYQNCSPLPCMIGAVSLKWMRVDTIHFKTGGLGREVGERGRERDYTLLRDLIHVRRDIRRVRWSAGALFYRQWLGAI